MKKISCLLSGIIILCSSVVVANDEEKVIIPPPQVEESDQNHLCYPLISKVQDRLRIIAELKYSFQTRYAPILWKSKALDWDLDREIQKIEELVSTKEDLSELEFHQALRQLFHSTRDYHAGIVFKDSTSACLPIQIKGDGAGNYFIVEINRKKAPFMTFPFNVGDRVISMNNESVESIVENLKLQPSGGYNTLADHALAEQKLTYRSRSSGDTIPEGAVAFEILSPLQEKMCKTQLVWDVSSEGDLDFEDGESGKGKMKFSHLFPSMHVPFLKTCSKKSGAFKVGSFKGFLPPLGKVLWPLDPSSESSLFHARIYMTETRGLIGFIRIPTFKCGSSHAEEFSKIISKFSLLTDVCVIDQTNNGGGSNTYMNQLISMLIDQPVSPPKGREIITEDRAIEAKNCLKLIKEQPELAKKELQEIFGKHLFDHNMLLLMKNYFHFIINEWKQGKYLSDYTYWYGINKILPHPQIRYTKPILLLINEGDFSCADLFPAILQDAKRVTIMGTPTAGAGGYVLPYSFPNASGIRAFYLTGSICEREGGDPIENLGVQPDIRYSPSIVDYQSGFAEYATAIKLQVNKMLTETQEVKEEESEIFLGDLIEVLKKEEKIPIKEEVEEKGTIKEEVTVLNSVF